MELEVREVTGEEKTKLTNRLKAYTNEMKRFDQDLVWEKNVSIELFSVIYNWFSNISKLLANTVNGLNPGVTCNSVVWSSGWV